MATAREVEVEVEGHIAGEVGSEELYELICQPCHEDGKIQEAVGLCIDCQDYLCQNCYDVHKTPKPMRNHELINKEQMLKSQVPIARKDKCTEKCSQHEEKTIKYYCKNHCQPLCSVCVNLQHRTCDGVTYIPYMAIDLENNEDFKQAEGQINSTVEKAECMLEKEKQTADAYYKDCSQVEETFQIFRKDINDALDKIEADIVTKIGTKKLQMSNRLSMVTGRIIYVQNELQQITTITNSLQHKGQNCDLFSFLMKSKDKLKTLNDRLKQIEIDQTRKIKGVRFLSNREIFKSLMDPEIFGRLIETETENAETEIETSTLVQVEHMYDIPIEINDTMGCYISGSVVLPDNNLLLVEFHTYSIKYVDTHSKKVIKDLRLPSRPYDIALTTNSQAAITLPVENKIAFVETKSTIMTVQRTVSLTKEGCSGLDYKEGKLAVAFPGFDTIQVLTLQGSLLHTIENKSRQNLFYSPHCVTFGQDSSTLYISNNYNMVVCVKVDGTVLATYADSMFKGSNTIITDKSGHVYVISCQKPYNIHQLTPDCRQIKILNGLDSLPTSISFNETENKLFVGMYQINRVKVYKGICGTP